MVKCDTCGKEFETSEYKFKRNKRHFCSKRCQYEGWKGDKNPAVKRGVNHPNWKGGKPVSICEYCGKTFEGWYNNKNRFCSRECHYKWKSENLRGKDNPLFNRVEVKCETCGKVILRILSHALKVKHHFCSFECRGKYWSKAMIGKLGKAHPLYAIRNFPKLSGREHPNYKERIVKECPICGKQFELVPWMARNRVYCSKECSDISILGENHPNWRGGTSFKPYPPEFNERLKEEIRERDGHECQLCGMTQEDHLNIYRRKLCVHHIDGNKQNCEKSNLTALCLICNLSVENNSTRLVGTVFPIREDNSQRNILCPLT